MNRTVWAQLLMCMGIWMVSLLIGTTVWLSEESNQESLEVVTDNQDVTFLYMCGVVTNSGK